MPMPSIAATPPISFYMGMCLLKMNNTTKERCEQGLATDEETL